MIRIDHVNLGVLPGTKEQTSGWLVDVLGCKRLSPPAEFVALGACWLETADGVQVHLTDDPDHRPASIAHVAVVVDDIEELASELASRATEVRRVDREDLTQLFCRDPAGNRWEIRSSH
jgi:hypothetical protein